jgi:hypothetical protein
MTARKAFTNKTGDRKMKKNILYMGIAMLTLASALASCSKESEEKSSNTTKGSVTVDATLGETSTKVTYTDGNATGGATAADITTAWESSDYLNVLEDGTNYKFSVSTIEGKGAKFTSSTAPVPTAASDWVAVLGQGASETGGTITCGYDGQDGTIENLGKYDYMVATATDTDYPKFSFGAGSRLTYFLRLKLPATIASLEFNVGTTDWSVTSAGVGAVPEASKTVGYVKTVTFKTATSAAGDVRYIAVPALNYSAAGLIVTIFNADGSKSQGKVITKDLTSLGGHIGTYDMSALTLMDRPTGNRTLTIKGVSTSDIVDMGTYGKWAAFNVGVDVAASQVATPAAKALFGNYYSWGRTEQSYDKSGNYYYAYPTYFFSQDQGGTLGNDPVADWYGSAFGNNDNVSINIAGSRFDVARVKWGKGWRMASYDEFKKFEQPIGSVSSDYGWVVVANGNTLYFPPASYYEGWGFASEPYPKCCYWTSQTRENWADKARFMCVASGEAALTEHTLAMSTYTRIYGMSIRAIVAE